jgi:hypothetical protein
MEEPNGNGKIKLENRLTRLEECNKYMQEDVTYIKRQVDNHLPTSIHELDKKMDSFILKAKTQFVTTLLGVLMLLIGVIIDITLKK